MHVPASAPVVRFFLYVLRLRRWIAAGFAVLTVAGILGALRLPDDVAFRSAFGRLGSTALGATENGQVHFFYHFEERRADGSTPEALRHALSREFGIVSASAFLLAPAGDLTALPGALWIVSRAHREVAPAPVELI